MRVLHLKVKGSIKAPCGTVTGKNNSTKLTEDVTCKSCLRLMGAYQVTIGRSLPHIGARAVDSEFHN